MNCPPRTFKDVKMSPFLYLLFYIVAYVAFAAVVSSATAARYELVA